MSKMCIRDRKYYEDSLDWENNPLLGWCEKNTKKDGTKYNLYTDGLKIYTTLDSVSYTHLDVYKRQSLQSNGPRKLASVK